MNPCRLNFVAIVCLWIFLASNANADCSVSTDLPDDTWMQIGLPCAPPDGEHSAGAIFGDVLGSNTAYGTQWAVFAYDPGSGSYNDIGYDGVMMPGKGYWIINRTGSVKSVSMPSGSRPASPTSSAECPSQSPGCLEIPLEYSSANAGQNQFNIISNPHFENQSWADMNVADNNLCSAANNSDSEPGTGCTLDEALARNIFNNTGWQYNGTNYNPVTSASTLPPWQGLWVAILAGEQPNNNLRLQLPVSNAECAIFPANNPWNQDISALPLHPQSAAYMASIGLGGRAHADFGTVYNGAPNGIPVTEVTAGTPRRNVEFQYADESDHEPYPIPNNPAIEGGNNGSGDRHIIMLDRAACKLYELFNAWPPGGAGNPFTDRWYAGSGAIFNLRSNQLRPDFWTSADAAGLPVYPGLVRYDEAVMQQEIRHALRFTARRTQRAFIYPATHFASSSSDANLPPMGLRVRLKAGFDTSGFSAEVQIILAALKKYGMLLADNGGDWFVSGAPDSRWNDDNLSELHNVPGSAFEAVYTGELITR